MKTMTAPGRLVGFLGPPKGNKKAEAFLDSQAFEEDNAVL